MKKSLFLASATLFALSVSASAQQFGNNNQGNFNQNNNRNNQGNNQVNNRGQNGGGATLPLPEGVKGLVSIDAFNMLLAEVDTDGKTDYAPIIVRHIYSGGIARLFGGTSVPTDQFISPGQLNGNNNGNNNGGGFGNNNNNGSNPFGGNNGGVSSFGGNNNGFGNNNNSFGGNSFGGNTFGGGFGNNSSFLMRPVPGRGN